MSIIKFLRTQFITPHLISKILLYIGRNNTEYNFFWIRKKSFWAQLVSMLLLLLQCILEFCFFVINFLDFGTGWTLSLMKLELYHSLCMVTWMLLFWFWWPNSLLLASCWLYCQQTFGWYCLATVLTWIRYECWNDWNISVCNI